MLRQNGKGITIKDTQLALSTADRTRKLLDLYEFGVTTSIADVVRTGKRLYPDSYLHDAPYSPRMHLQKEATDIEVVLTRKNQPTRSMIEYSGYHIAAQLITRVLLSANNDLQTLWAKYGTMAEKNCAAYLKL
ncbi:hypothetical protein H0G86_000351 [Trichoderma simmonsii]|uniref:Uncharacterized protein n=1 Tax=Trichoderma simmonsii TaxID=1491479 RepID=A0A8G0L4R9_9HYPO|nr:hypothetical protein H0G86_000351 [Trichoderma simmonsii]